MTHDDGGSPMTLEVLAALMTTYHQQAIERLDKIDEKQAIANGRTGKNEQQIAVLMWTARMFGAIGIVALGAWLSKVL